MQAIVAVAVSGLSWYYCSNRCLQRSVNELSRDVEAQIRDCLDCIESNEELLEVLAGGEPPEHEHPVPSIRLNAEPRPMQQTARCECRPGKIANNSFFNFVRERRRQNCGQQQKELVRAAAADWNDMTEEQKSGYQKKNVFKNNRKRQWSWTVSVRHEKDFSPNLS